MESRRNGPVACVHCRQMKLRCDGHQRFPASCSRCDKAGLRCSIDPGFKRTSKRERLDALERELRDVRKSLHSGPDRATLPAVANDESIDYSEASRHSPDQTTTPKLSPERFTSRVLEGIELVPELIADLVNEYYANYHPELPILPDVADFIIFTDNCPLLFWTVMAMGARRGAEHRHLYLQLAGPLLDMAYLAARPANRSLGSIQALLLLCSWPLPFGATRDDPSPTFVAQATVDALRLGLHRPKHPSDFEYNASPDIGTLVLRQKTWIACFIINQKTLGQHGIPTMTRPDQSILEAAACKPAWLPDPLYRQLHLVCQEHSIVHTLSHVDMSSTGLLPCPIPTIRAFEAELKIKEAQFADSWTKQDLISYLACRLLLYGFALIDADPTSSCGLHSRQPEPYWSPQAYQTATRLLQQTADIGPPLLLSSHTRWCIIYAIFFLFKLPSYTCTSWVDDNTIRNCINQGWVILKSCSLTTNDSSSRACAVIEYLIKISESRIQHEREPFTLIKSRMGANICFDSVFRARSRFSQPVKDQKPRDYTEAAEHENIVRDREDGLASTLFSSELISSANIEWDTILQDIWLN